MKIKNFEQLAQSDVRKKALKIAEAGLEAIDTSKAVADAVSIKSGELFVKHQKFSLHDYKNIYVVAIGKCANEAARVLEQVLGDRIADGIAFDLKKSKFKKLKSYAGKHPYPAQMNVDITEEIIKLLKPTTERDLVIFIVSGGGSTLLCSPDKMFCQDEVKILQALFKAGANIKEINTVRKHISRARGGQLAKYAYPSRVVSLIFSDIPGNDLTMVASGPTYLDATTIEDAEAVLSKYQVLKKCSLDHCGLIETPKQKKYFENVTNILLVSDELALHAMAAEAQGLGFRVRLKPGDLKDDILLQAPKVLTELNEMKPSTVLLYSGETTMTKFNARGGGGRNLELALATVRRLRDNELVLTLASDGEDNSDLAGAIADQNTFHKLQKLGDVGEQPAYGLFKQTGDYILTGKTGSNISDLLIALK